VSILDPLAGIKPALNTFWNPLLVVKMPRLDNKDEATPQTAYAAKARLASAIKGNRFLT